MPRHAVALKGSQRKGGEKKRSMREERQKKAKEVSALYEEISSLRRL